MAISLSFKAFPVGWGLLARPKIVGTDEQGSAMLPDPWSRNFRGRVMARVEAIKHEAARLMAERGYAGVSLRQLAEAVGIQPGSVYAHFTSKEELLQALCCDFQADLMSAWVRRRRCSDPKRALLAFVAVYVRFHLVRGAEGRVLLLDFRSLDLQGKQVVGELRARYEAELDEILQRGVVCGAFVVGEVVLARKCILSLLQGLCVARDACSVWAVRAVYRDCAEAVLRQVGACG